MRVADKCNREFSTSCLLSLMLCPGDSGLSVLSVVSIPSVGAEERGNVVITMGAGKTLWRRTGFTESLNISARRKEVMS